jgi:hypothetical protein
VELAEVSLWLNTIHEGAFVPWFGTQLVTGNSLVGARRQVYDAKFLKKETQDGPLWLDEVPERVMPGEIRRESAVYHFLLPDRGMVDYKDRVVREMAKAETKKITEWRKGFTKPFSDSQVNHLKKLSSAVDRLLERHTQQLRNIRQRTDDVFPIFGKPEINEPRRPMTTAQKDKVFEQELLSWNVRNSSPYRRLKLAMDYWCSLWFWPIEKADLLPTREEFLFDLSLILEGNVIDVAAGKGEMDPLFPDSMPRQEALKLVDEYGYVNVDKLCLAVPRLKLVQELYDKYRFLHWELQFADIFAHQGGFDLVLGNPPWIKVEWNEGGVMGDNEPLLVLRDFSAPQLAELREETIKHLSLRGAYLTAFEEAEGTQAFLNAMQNYPYLKKIQTNSYKCFLTQAWMIWSAEGVAGFLHPEGVYDDPNGGIFREALYPRLAYHFQFWNQLMFFPIAHRERYSINVYDNRSKDNFYSLSNLFHPSTVDKCFDSIYGSEPIPGFKDENDNWDLRGHPDRIVRMGIRELDLCQQIYEGKDGPALMARLPALHSSRLLSVLAKLSSWKERISSCEGRYLSTEMWHETNAQKDGTIERKTQFPDDTDSGVLSGPHCFVGNPMYKTPRNACEQKADYDILDLTVLPNDYVPRTNYIRACSREEYEKRIPAVPWENERRVLTTEFYRVVFRGMLSQAAERTLITALIPKGICHINGVQSVAFQSPDVLLSTAFFCFSIIADFLIKSTGRTNLHYTWKSFPLIGLTAAMKLWTLMLSCLTTRYSGLWSACWDPSFSACRWAKLDPRLDNHKLLHLTPEWHRDCALRTDYERRQALVEIDVLAAMTLGLTLDELKTIYRIQFPVLQEYERDTWYDRNGRIIFTISRGLTGVGLPRQDWERIRNMEFGSVSRTITDDTLPGGPQERSIVYEAPFDCCDRERDYATAWAEFNRRFKEPGS